MNNRSLLKGLFLMMIALAFGLGSLGSRVGDFGQSGPGLFPLMVSSLLFVLALATVAQSFALERLPLEFNLKNIAIIVISLCAFALISEYLNMIVGITVMVFCATLAGKSYSITRNLAIASGLIVIALVFKEVLRLELPLY